MMEKRSVASLVAMLVVGTAVLMVWLMARLFTRPKSWLRDGLR